MSNQLIVTQPDGRNDLTNYPSTPLEIAGQVANRHARAAVFDDYLSRKSDNTIRTQAAALALFADFLADVGIPGITAESLQTDPAAWRGVTWGIVESFVKWLLGQGYSVASVNNRLSAVKVYAKLASKAGTVDKLEYLQIKDVSGYAGKEAKRVNERREVTRVGDKKAEHVSLTPAQAAALKGMRTYEGPQGARDKLLMCLLLDHGLRVGEVAALKVTDFNLKTGELRFYRPKVDKEQLHRLTADTAKAAHYYILHHAPVGGLLLLGSTKDGRLTSVPMSARAITKRVAYLGRKLLGIEGLSAHDCRHFWATDAARNGTDPFRLQEAGGWSSLVMPRRYVEAARIANQGVKLSS